jgi:hypothetical protein
LAQNNFTCVRPCVDPLNDPSSEKFHPARVYSRRRYSPELSLMTGACTFCDIEPSNRGIKFEGEYPAKPDTEDQESDIKFKFSNNLSATDTHALGTK